MSDYKEKIRNRENSLKQTIDQVIGGQEAINEINFERLSYDDAFLAHEVSEQERFKKMYHKQNKNLPDDNNISAPKDYELKEIAIQERKYGYFAKRSRIKSARSQKDAYKTSIDSLKINQESDRYDFSVSDDINEDTQDFMVSTRRLVAIENKKRELISNTLTDDALKALKDKSEVSASVLNEYKTTILQLGPSIETVPKNDESINDEIVFSQESIQAYEAYLKFVVSDPIGAIKAAITDTLHTVTTFPQKMLGKKAIPQSFDRLMQIRDRYNAINKLRKHRMFAKDVDAIKNPLGALMSKLYPKEDVAKENHGQEHAHNESDNFEFIKMMEKAINSDMVTCLKKAGITYKKGLFGTKKSKDYIDSDGNASKGYYESVKKMLSQQDDAEKEEKKRLNKNHWDEREKAAYEAVKDPNANNADLYGIMRALNKIKTDAAGKKKIKYNTNVAGKLEERLGKLNTAIGELKIKSDNSDKALKLAQVMMSTELSARMKANALKTQYDLAVLLERVKGYINAYDHTVSGANLNEYGSAIMEEMKLSETEDGWTVYEEKIDTRYNTDNIERINRIATSKSNAQDLIPKNDKEAVRTLRDAICEIDKDASSLIHEIKSINRANKNTVIDKIIDFRKSFYSATKIMGHNLSNGQDPMQALFMAISDEKEREKAMSAYGHTMTKCHFICTYADLFRTENIIGTYSESKLPKEIILDEEEKQFTQKNFKNEKQALKLQLDTYLKELTEYEKAQGKNAIELDLFDENPEALEEDVENILETALQKINIDNFSEAEMIQQQQPVQDRHEEHVNDQQEHVNDQHEEEEPVIRRNVQLFQRYERQEQPEYQKRVVSNAAMRIVNENSLNTTDKFVKFLVYQLMQLNKINQVTWEEVKKESKAWLVGRNLIHENVATDITDENIDNILETIHRELVNGGEVLDESQYTQEDKQRYKDEDLIDKQYAQDSIQNLLKEALYLNSSEECDGYVTKEVSDNAPEIELQKHFKTAFKTRFDDNVANIKNGKVKTKRDDITIPEKDNAHVRWFIENFPQNARSENEITKFYRDWNKKVGYDMLNGKVLDYKTYIKLKCILESWQAAIESAVNIPKANEVIRDLDNVDLNGQIQDMGLANEEKTIPNVHQWYSLSCWATSGSLITNWYMKNVLKLENAPKIDQMDFLSPENIVLNPYSEDALRKEKLNPNGDEGISAEERNIKNFVKPAGSTGNIMTTADVMLSKMSNTAIRHLRFNIPKGGKYYDPTKFSDEQWNKLSKMLFNRISELMGGGSGPISLLIPGHYRTIIGFKDGKLRVRDSMLANGEVEEDISVETFASKIKAAVRNTGYSFELVFLQNMSDQNKEKMKEEYGCEYDDEGNLKYTDKEEEILAQSPTNILHNLGMSYDRKNKKSDNLLDIFMQDEIYVPKNLDCSKNVENVNRKITETRRKLGLEDITEDQKKEAEKNKKEFDKVAKQKRKEEAEKWEKTAIKSQSLINEENAKQVFKDKFTEEEKEELIKKTINFNKQLKSNKKIKDKDKKVQPTAMDVIHSDYEEKSLEIEKKKEVAKDYPMGWILTDKDMKTVEDLLKKDGNAFANKVVENKESSVQNRNNALAAIKQGDVSMFNHLPGFIKEYYGRKSLEEFFGDNRYFKAGIIPPFATLTKQEKEKLAQKTRDPIFRSIINMMIIRRSKDKKNNEAWMRLKEYDAFMNQQLILQTLAPITEEDKKRLQKENKKLKKSKYDGRESAETMIANNVTKQRHMAKMMFLMQLGRFDQFDTDETGVKKPSHYKQNIAEAIAHGSRVGVCLPAGNTEDQTKIYNAWKGDAANLMFSRFATHEFSRKKAKIKNSFFKEIKLKGMKFSFKKLFKNWHEERPSSYSDNYGLNLALGGLGKEFNGSVIDDQGKFAHLYQRFRMGDKDTCGGMLFGIENSAPGGTCVTNFKQYFGGYNGTSCIGELHNGKAISHGQSAFFSSKENYGDQYGGRTVDLSNIEAGKLADVISKFDAMYKKLQEEVLSTDKNKRKSAERKLQILNKKLSGRILTAQELYDLLRVCKFKPSEAKHIANSARSINGATYTKDKTKYPENMYKALTEMELDRRRDDEMEQFFSQYQEMNDEQVEGNE